MTMGNSSDGDNADRDGGDVQDSCRRFCGCCCCCCRRSTASATTVTTKQNAGVREVAGQSKRKRQRRGRCCRGGGSFILLCILAAAQESFFMSFSFLVTFFPYLRKSSRRSDNPRPFCCRYVSVGRIIQMEQQSGRIERAVVVVAFLDLVMEWCARMIRRTDAAADLLLLLLLQTRVDWVMVRDDGGWDELVESQQGLAAALAIQNRHSRLLLLIVDILCNKTHARQR
jgi:hypothetical protein